MVFSIIACPGYAYGMLMCLISCMSALYDLVGHVAYADAMWELMRAPHSDAPPRIEVGSTEDRIYAKFSHCR